MYYYVSQYSFECNFEDPGRPMPHKQDVVSQLALSYVRYHLYHHESGPKHGLLNVYRSSLLEGFLGSCGAHSNTERPTNLIRVIIRTRKSSYGINRLEKDKHAQP